MKRVSRTAVAATIALLAGCVVIPDTFDANINVTIRHIQEQAEGILNYVEGKTEALPELAPAPEQESSLFERALDALDPIQTAYAAEVKEDSARVKQIANSMRARMLLAICLTRAESSFTSAAYAVWIGSSASSARSNRELSCSGAGASSGRASVLPST